MEYAESNYYKLRIAEQVAGLVPPGPFWLDYVRHADGPFLSPNLADASRSFTEMAFALSVLDLPFEPGKHEVQFDGGKMTLTPAGPAVAFHEEVRPADAPDGKVPVLVGQNFYRHGDRFREEGGEKVDKYVAGEFLVHAVYGCQVVVTNPTSARQRLTVLAQLPVGAIPLAGGQYTKSVLLDLEPYRTQTVDYLFYFPRPGKFAHFPAHVGKNEKVVAAAKPATFDVVEKLSKPDTSSWDYVSQHGTDDEVMAMLERENVAALNLDRIAFRMRDRAFFERATALLKARHQYSPTLWSYGLFHNAPAVAKEFLTHADQLAAEVGGPIDTPLFTLDPVARHQYEHLEYRPVVNARAHALGDRRQVVNAALHEQYHRLLKQLSYRTQLTDDDLLAVTYYLLVQDRVDESLASFRRVHRDKVATQVQYDYCAAYLALCEEKPEVARSIAYRYERHPVDRWRKAFAEVVNHTRRGGREGRPDRRRRRPRPAPGPTRRHRSGVRGGGGEPGRPAHLAEPGRGAGELPPDGRRAAVQPLAVRPGVGRAVRVHQADRDHDHAAARREDEGGRPAAGRAGQAEPAGRGDGGRQDPVGAGVRGRDGRAADGGVRPGEGDQPDRRAAAAEGVREGVRPAGGRAGEVPQGRVHRPARPVRLRLGEHPPAAAGGAVRGAGAQRGPRGRHPGGRPAPAVSGSPAQVKSPGRPSVPGARVAEEGFESTHSSSRAGLTPAVHVSHNGG